MTVNIGPHEFDHVRYDQRGDVLYLSIGEPREAADSLVTPEGHVLRYDDTNRIIGITFINAKWLTDQDARAGPTAQPGKTMQALKTLEDMKNGLADTRNSDRIPEAALLEFGPDPGR